VSAPAASAPGKTAEQVIAFSISYERDTLLRRGMGYDHLRELLIRLARRILRRRISVAYGGNWRRTEQNFTFELLNLIADEQADSTSGGTDTGRAIGRLYNHSSWPNYLDVTTQVEAQWINSCRVIRVTQQQAGFAGDEVVSDEDAPWKMRFRDPRTMFNAAATLSAMRRLMMGATEIHVPDVPAPEKVPAVAARILLGGGVERYSGFVPGIFEEALATLEHGKPAYILGGFGGAAEVLSDAILAPGTERPERLTLEWHKEHNERLSELLDSSEMFPPPRQFRSTKKLLDDLYAFVLNARADLPNTLRTGLDGPETRELMTTRDIATAVRLVRKGLASSLDIQP
jgi:hypothetical protein